MDNVRKIRFLNTLERRIKINQDIEFNNNDLFTMTFEDHNSISVFKIEIPEGSAQSFSILNTKKYGDYDIYCFSESDLNILFEEDKNDFFILSPNFKSFLISLTKTNKTNVYMDFTSKSSLSTSTNYIDELKHLDYIFQDNKEYVYYYFENFSKYTTDKFSTKAIFKIQNSGNYSLSDYFYFLVPKSDKITNFVFSVIKSYIGDLNNDIQSFITNNKLYLSLDIPLMSRFSLTIIKNIDSNIIQSTKCNNLIKNINEFVENEKIESIHYLDNTIQNALTEEFTGNFMGQLLSKTTNIVTVKKFWTLYVKQVLNNLPSTCNFNEKNTFLLSNIKKYYNLRSFKYGFLYNIRDIDEKTLKKIYSRFNQKRNILLIPNEYDEFSNSMFSRQFSRLLTTSNKNHSYSKFEEDYKKMKYYKKSTVSNYLYYNKDLCIILFNPTINDLNMMKILALQPRNLIVKVPNNCNEYNNNIKLIGQNFNANK